MSKLIKSRAGHRGHVKKLVYEWPGLRVEKDAVLSEESRCRLEYILETMNTKILLLQKLDDDVLKEVEDGDGDISEEIIATCEYMDDVSIQRDLLKRYLLSTVERLTSANSLASTQHFSSSLEPAAASVTFDSCDRGTCSSIGAESGAQAPQAMATAGWNPAAALATSTPGGPSTLATGSGIPVFSSSSRPSSNVKLPKLSLATFSGRAIDWYSFWECFQSMIDSNLDLSQVDKLSYLKSLLRGPAQLALEGLSMTGPNYDVAVDILRQRYGDIQRIISDHMDALLHLEAVQYTKPVSRLRALLDKVEIHVRSLDNLGRAPQMYGDMYVPVLFTKLPAELRLSLCERIPATSCNLPAILIELRTDIEARERADYLGISVSTPKKEITPRLTGPPTASALATTSSGGTPPEPCVYCDQNHDPSRCSMITDVERRREILLRHGRCYICLKARHISRYCRSNLRCVKCQRRHHVSICDQQAGTTSAMTGTVSGDHQAILLQTATATIASPSHPETHRQIRLILDGGSQRSYVTTHTQQALGLPVVHKELLTIKPFGDEQGSTRECDIVEIDLALQDGSRTTVSAISVPYISSEFEGQYIADAMKRYGYLQGMKLADNGECSNNIDMLLGADIYWQIVTGRTVRGKGGPVAIETRLGWVLSGPTQAAPCSARTTTSLFLSAASAPIPATCRDPDDALLDEVKRFWDLEAIGITSNEHTVHEAFKQSITHDGERYTVHLPWREMHPALPDGYHLSKKRLESTFRKLKKSPEILKEYDAVIQDQLKRGIVERVVSTNDIPGEVHYLPHHPVIRQAKTTTKVRVVYDASAKTGSNPSLNECLHTGPSLLESIPDILLRFRTHKVALIGDVEKAFLMVGITEADRDVLRFLWFDDAMAEAPTPVVLRFARVVFGVSSSPFLLNATIQHHIERYANDPEFVRQVLDSLYVDDVAAGGSDDLATYELYTKLKTRLAEGGFNIRKFSSNSAILMSKIEANEQALSGNDVQPVATVTADSDSYAASTLNSNSTASTKVLGIPWNRESDMFELELNAVFANATTDPVTKREVLAISSRFYDPLGLLAPAVITLKIFFQELCSQKLAWDDTLTGDLANRWAKIVSDMQNAPVVSVPRCYLTGSEGKITSVSLHGFCDASCKAFAAVVYLVLSNGSQNFVQLAASKSRVAPLAKQTIPRLELLSALILARLMTVVKNALCHSVPIDSIHCWTDSQVALYWIVGVNHDWKQFVQNRVQEIRRLISPDCWEYCPTASNPADLPSRGVRPADLLSSIWYSGPAWLTDGSFPKSMHKPDAPPPAATIEMKRHAVMTPLLTTSATGSAISSVITISQFSSLTKLLRVTARVIQFTQILRRKAIASTTLTASNLDCAEEFWLRDVQREAMKDSKAEKWCREFGVFTDEHGLLRCGGRLQNAQLSQNQKHPLLLYQTHPFTSLVVQNCHANVHHNGVKETLTELRSRYWIIRGRQFVRKLIHDCRVCRRHEGVAYAPEISPALPEFRTTVDFPFSYTGVDFAGPLFVAEGAEMKKVYIALFTCGVSRALYLDLVPDLTGDAFLRCFKRFTARHGIPKEMKSDNGKTFKAAAKSLTTLFDIPHVSSFLASRKVKWSFNLEKAPWWGGFFERMVRCVKRCLKKTLSTTRLSYEELLTVLIDIESVLNSRPLTYLSTEDLEEPLTPSHLLHGRRVRTCPEADPDDVDMPMSVHRDDLLRRLAYIKLLSDHFWSRWTSEYLLELRNAHRSNQPSHGPKISVGDVVLIAEDGVKRGQWSLALVERLMEGVDSKVRGAVLKTTTASGKPTTLRRPVQRLYPVEFSLASSTPAAEEVASAAQVDVPSDVQARPRRAAAEKSAANTRALAGCGQV